MISDRSILAATLAVSCAGAPATPGADELPVHAAATSSAPVRPPPEPAPAPEPVVAPEPVPAPEPIPDPGPPADPETCLPADASPRIEAVQRHVDEASGRHGVDPDLINGLIWVESKFKTKARGPGGSQGLMQLMPGTARGVAKKLGRPARPYDPSFNIDAGTYYLGRMLQKFEGDETHALAAYNRGAGVVRKWIAQRTPFPEGVMGFVDKVQRARRCFAAR